MLRVCLLITLLAGACNRPGVVSIDLPLGEARQHLVERDAPFEARQRGAEAEVDAVTEGETLLDLAMDVEAVAAGETTVIAVRRADEEDHHVACRHFLAVVLDVARHVSGDVWRRRLVAEDLLDRVRDQ